MGYVLRVRMASFFSGAAIASFAGFYILHRDYKIAHESFANQMKNLHESLDSRISALEKLRQTENSKQLKHFSVKIAHQFCIQIIRGVHGSDRIRKSAVNIRIRSKNCGYDSIRKLIGSDPIRSALFADRIADICSTSAYPIRGSAL
ncbi:uncharacterized protein DS421_20g696460 [Arachis hypogaea]|nr:uncharacterized protein DS421_20g696460 [Arachis hypogaea]